MSLIFNILREQRASDEPALDALIFEVEDELWEGGETKEGELRRRYEDAFAWWTSLSRKWQRQFADAILGWESVLVHELPKKRERRRKAPTVPKVERRPKVRSVAARPLRPPQDPHPLERAFGYCKRCKVCLAYDVNLGCCTVCGGPLATNPPRRRKREKLVASRSERRRILRKVMRS
jgi:hypothetical protein